MRGSLLLCAQELGGHKLDASFLLFQITALDFTDFLVPRRIR